MSSEDVTSDVEGGCPETVIHNFCHQELDCDFSCQVLKMVDSIYLWVGGNGENDHNMLNFVTSCKSRYDDSRPLTAAIMNGSFEARAGDIAERLCQRTGKHVFVSYNIDCNDHQAFLIERKVVEQMKALSFF